MQSKLISKPDLPFLIYLL